MRKAYEVLMDSEKIKSEKTISALNGLYIHIPEIYNCLLQLSFCVGTLCENDDDNMVKIQDIFQFYVHDFGFKVRNIFYLMEIGSYTDAAILFRSLIEKFIVYKFYICNNDGTGLSKHVLGESRRSIKDIFEKVVPDYYDDEYALLCKFTHSDPLTQAIFRGNVSKDEPLKSSINNINLEWYSFILNQLLPTILGLINLYEYVYPNNTLKTRQTLSEDIDAIKQFINNDISSRLEEFPKMRTTILRYNEIIDI